MIKLRNFLKRKSELRKRLEQVLLMDRAPNDKKGKYQLCNTTEK